MKNIPLSAPNLSLDIVENLRECIETGWVSTGGRFITEFEEKVAKYVGVDEAVSTQSGTAGLHLALITLGIGAGDKVLVPTLTFVAAVTPVIYAGATPVFMDCDDSLCMDLDKVEEYLKSDTKKSVKAIIIVHIFGNMCDMNRLMQIAGKYDVKIIEDATEALGSHYTDDKENGEFAGRYAGTMGDIGVYSFNANKIITTGGGGMIVAKDKKHLDHMRHLSITAKTDSLYFIHDEVGYNYRMLNIQAALGVSQIDQLEDFIATKIENYNLYVDLLSCRGGYYPSKQTSKNCSANGNHPKPISILPFADHTRCNHWFYSLIIPVGWDASAPPTNNRRGGYYPSKQTSARDVLMNGLIADGIQCRPIWKLIHTLKPYEKYEAYLIEKAYFYVENILNLPCSTNLSKEDVKYVCEKIKNII